MGVISVYSTAFSIPPSIWLLAYRPKAGCVKLVGVKGWFVEKVVRVEASM
jgi:hypothetical protein